MIKVSKAIILGAGLGTRLATLTEKKPKSLLRINDKTILKHQIECLNKAGIEDITMIIGHMADKIKQFCEENSLNIDFVFNPNYSETNNLYSLHLAKSHFEGGFISLNSDVMFEKTGLDKLVNSIGEINLLVEPKDCSKEDMKVSLRKGKKIDKVSKNLDRREVYGEFTGMAKFSAKSIDRLKEIIRNIPSNRLENMFLGSAFQVMSEKGLNVSAVDIDFNWKDIDNPEDLEEARKFKW